MLLESIDAFLVVAQRAMHSQWYRVSDKLVREPFMAQEARDLEYAVANMLQLATGAKIAIDYLKDMVQETNTNSGTIAPPATSSDIVNYSDPFTPSNPNISSDTTIF
jgi:hypothetical protein